MIDPVSPPGGDDGPDVMWFAPEVVADQLHRTQPVSGKLNCIVHRVDSLYDGERGGNSVVRIYCLSSVAFG